MKKATARRLSSPGRACLVALIIPKSVSFDTLYWELVKGIQTPSPTVRGAQPEYPAFLGGFASIYSHFPPSAVITELKLWVIIPK